MSASQSSFLSWDNRSSYGDGGAEGPLHAGPVSAPSTLLTSRHRPCAGHWPFESHFTFLGLKLHISKMETHLAIQFTFCENCSVYNNLTFLKANFIRNFFQQNFSREWAVLWLQQELRCPFNLHVEETGAASSWGSNGSHRRRRRVGAEPWSGDSHGDLCHGLLPARSLKEFSNGENSTLICKTHYKSSVICFMLSSAVGWTDTVFRFDSWEHGVPEGKLQVPHLMAGRQPRVMQGHSLTPRVLPVTSCMDWHRYLQPLICSFIRAVQWHLTYEVVLKITT